MPPERLPWDRKDNYKERKYERSVPRWRETTSFSSSSSGHYRDFSRWGGGSNEFRRPPPGHGKQGGWNLFPEEPGHGGYVPFRSSERILEDKNCRPSISRGDSKYGRSSRDNRGSCGSQRDWRTHPSWEMSNGSPNTTGRFHDVGNDQRSAEDMVGYPSPFPRTEFANNRYQFPLKDSHNNDNNNNNISSSSNNDIDNNNSSSGNNGPNNKMAGAIGLATGQRCDPEDSLDWKLVKWTRPGSLSCRGSGFGHSTSSKSLGVAEFVEGKAELQIKNSSLVHSPSGDATTCVTSSPSEDTTARKKQRLNWGEGLAKYEKKKVEVPEVNVNEGVVTSSNAEPNHSQSSNLVDKSPRVLGLSECASPATPSSVAFSSPGIEEKTCGRGMNAENDVTILCGSPSMGSHTHVEDISFNLEVLDATSIANLGSSLVELLQSDDLNSLDSNFARSTVMNKLLILKGDISKALEVTESEIDSLETELKSLKFASESRSPCPASSSCFPLLGGATLDCEQGAVSNNIAGPSPLQVSCSGAEHMKKIPCCNGGVTGDIHGGIKDDDVDSPGTATSKFVEPMLMEKAVSSFDVGKPLECSGDVGVTPVPTTVLQSFVPCPKQQDVSVPTFRDDSSPSEAKEGSCFSSDASFAEDNLCSSILAANKESANRASEVFDNLLPRDPCAVVSNIVQWQNASHVKERFAMRKRFLRFKERAVTLKYKAFQHLWKEDMRLQSLRKYRAKSQKRYDMSLWTTHTGQQKNRSSIRSRFSSPVGNLSLVPISEMLNAMRKLLSISQVNVHRNALKMPALILDKKERMASRFISSNALIEDPWAVEKERAMINPWTAEEREIFIDKLATIGKDFQKIASFFDHKTTADCVEFYYKNHKSDCFGKTKKCKQTKSSANYLMSSGKTMNRAMNAASLDILGAASLMAAGTGDDMGNEQISSGRMYLAGYRDSKKLNVGNGNLDHLSNFDILESEKETVAADVLAGICGSMSSEAVSSCITTSVDPLEGCRDWKPQSLNYVKNQPSTSDVTQNIDEDTCSDESCGEMDLADWTDEEKSLFIQAVSSYGKDFAMISRCVRTRSRDQCKVFFSKARKCLGLDSMHLTSGNAGTPMSDDANGGGSDTEDGCAVEVCSTICNDKLDAKVVEHLPLGVMETKLEEPNTIERKSSGINMDICENGNVAGISNQNDPIVEKFCASDASPMECKSELAFADDVNVVNPIVHQSDFSEAQEISNESVSSEAEREKPVEGCMPVENAISAGPSNRVVFEVKARPKVYIDCNGDQLQGKEPSLHGNRLHSQMLDAGDSRAVSRLPSDVGSSSNYCIGGENLHQVSLEFGTVEKSHIISLQQESELATNAGMHDSAMIECEKMRDKDRQPSEPSGVDNHFPQFPGSLVNCTKTYQKRETDEDTSCRLHSEMQRIVTLERNGASQFVAQDCSLRKCNTAKAQCSVHELPLLAQHTEQVNGHPRDHSWCSSDVEKPLKNGDVKLFGKILSNSSSHESTPGVHENGEAGAQSATVGNKSSSTLKFTSHQVSDKGTSVLKFDHANYSGLENVPVKSYGFWDGNKIQTGFSSLPPEYFLAKYPAAFSNYRMSSSKIEQQAFPAALKCTDHVSALPPRETSGSNGVMDYQIYRGHDSNKEKTFAVEVKQRQDMFPSEMQRLNGFEAISSLQQQGRGTVGLNVVGRGGIVVGGVSDPVTALKMHYAKTEQCGGQTIMSEDEPASANLEKQKG